MKLIKTVLMVVLLGLAAKSALAQSEFPTNKTRLPLDMCTYAYSLECEKWRCAPPSPWRHSPDLCSPPLCHDKIYQINIRL